MCGKFTQRKNLPWRDLHDNLDLIGVDEKTASPLAEQSADEIDTVTPMRFARILRLDAAGAREAVAMRWGFSALGAQNPSKPDHIHARAETIDEKPTFRDAF